MKRIPLRNRAGLIVAFTKVDDVDFVRVNRFRWYLHKITGYVIKGTRKEKTSLHRFLMGSPLNKDVDHINHDRIDNRRKNLRICTRSQNQANKNHAAGRSGLKGVIWITQKKKWVARVKKEGKVYHAGFFNDKIEAAVAYNRLAKKLFGKFVCLNKIN